MNTYNHLLLSTSSQTQSSKNLRKFANLALHQRHLHRKLRRNNTGKELDTETGLYYYGARYLDPKASRWLSGDPAVGEYIPSAPVNEEARKRNGNLPGMGGVFNYVNLHVYHYAGNNPVKLVDPDGRTPGDPFDTADEAAIDALDYINPKSIRENREYAGMIYQDPTTQKFYATEPRRGSATISEPGSAPEGTNSIAYYHTHADYSIRGPFGIIIRTSDQYRDDHESNKISYHDSDYARHHRINCYLGTPSGSIKKFDLSTTERLTYNRSSGNFINLNDFVRLEPPTRADLYTGRDSISYIVPY